MGHLQLLPGGIAVAADRLVAIVRVEPDGRVAIRDLASGRIGTVCAAELGAAPPLSEPAASVLLSADEDEWACARQREAAIAPIVNTDDVAGQVAQAASCLGVSRRTVFRWLARYRAAPQTSSLLPRARGTPAGPQRIDAKLEALVAEAINEVYLTHVRARKEEVVRRVRLRCAAEGLRPPSRKAVLARLRQLDPRQVAMARLQPSEAHALHDPVPGTYRVERALDVVQIDHTRVDVMVVDEAHQLALDRPWLTLAVDVATRMVAGFYVSLEAPSATSVALCLTQAALPKEPWLQERGLACAWPVWGLPRAVHADNGADFRSAALRRGCDEHGIRLMLRPVATPHYGGHIERLIGTLMGRVHLLPGTTGSNPQEKGAYPAENEACLTMAELERWLALEICEQYHQRVHKGLHRAPLAAWQDAVQRAGGAAGALPDRPDQFTIGFLPFEQRSLRRDGLHLFNIRYWDPVLPTIARTGEPVLVRYDPRNLSKVYVAGPDRRYHPIPYADLGLPPITLWEQCAAVARLHREGNRAQIEAAMFRAVLEQRALVEKAMSKTRAARRQAQRQKDAALATVDAQRSEGRAVDYSQPVAPSDAEIWDD